MKRLAVLTGLAAATLLTVTACSGSTPGQPNPAPVTTTTTTTSTPSGSDSSDNTSNPPSSSTGGGPLAGADPCSLLSQSDAQNLKFIKGPVREKIGTADTCRWNPRDMTVAVGIRTNVGLAGVQANGNPITDSKIGGHQTRQTLGSGGSCIIAIGVTPSSRVDVLVTTGPSTDPCPTALQVAQLVEPRLPAS
ncbi:DUF3558 family protein [Solihabitans fulvus]|uniref:DUF3558 family protein n=1 Tax=Solihabitans fulvus TaxID=1892852 RepID=UPI001661DEA3